MQIEKVRAIVTGAASGLGKTFALELAKAGAWVAAGDIDTAGLDTLATESTGLPGRLVTGKLDISQEPSVVKFVGDISRELGELNVLVNNAGILRRSSYSSLGHRTLRHINSVWKAAPI